MLYINGEKVAQVVPGGGDILFDNSGTDLSSTNIQDAIVEVNNNIINPPDLSNITRDELTSGTATEFTSTGKWYCVKAINEQVEGTCAAYLLDSSGNIYLSASTAPTATWSRCTTAWLYFPAGTKFYARAFFSASGQSGLFSAPCL